MKQQQPQSKLTGAPVSGWTVSWVSAVISGVALSLIIYQMTVGYEHYVAAQRLHSLSKEFTEIPNVERFHPIAGEVIEKSRRVVDTGVLPATIRRWGEGNIFYRLSVAESWTMTIGLIVLGAIIIICAFFFGFNYLQNNRVYDQAFKIKQMVYESKQKLKQIKHEENTATTNNRKKKCAAEDVDD